MEKEYLPRHGDYIRLSNSISERSSHSSRLRLVRRIAISIPTNHPCCPLLLSTFTTDSRTIMDHSHMDHGNMGHGGMDHGGMDHGNMCNMNVSLLCFPSICIPKRQHTVVKAKQKKLIKDRCSSHGTPKTSASSSNPGASPPQHHSSGLSWASCC